jgi:hypothetical protein
VTNCACFSSSEISRRLELDLRKRLCKSFWVSECILRSSADGESSCAEGTRPERPCYPGISLKHSARTMRESKQFPAPIGAEKLCSSNLESQCRPMASARLTFPVSPSTVSACLRGGGSRRASRKYRDRQNRDSGCGLAPEQSLFYRSR